MKKKALLFIAILSGLSTHLYAQTSHPAFPQHAITQALKHAYQKAPDRQQMLKQHSENTDFSSPRFALYQKHNFHALEAKWNSGNISTQSDTLLVGFQLPDTVTITSTWTHTGPILIGNNGVLLIKNANMTNYGDVYVFGHGQLIADSSSLYFPQQYVYQRSLIVVQNGKVNITNSSVNYGGLSHNLVVTDSGYVNYAHLDNYDWTTAGLYGHAQVHLNDINMAGEYIFTDSCIAAFDQTTELLLWHQFPDTAVINYSFPNGDTVNTYHFADTIPGIAGIRYGITLDTCYNVMWGMMPVNGSQVNISNSKIRTIGLWFQHGDQATVNGLVNNSTYTNFSAPLSDRTLNLTNCNVQTWSLYTFDSSAIQLNGGCILGEVGSENKSNVTASNFYLDGSGGYYWAADTSFNVTTLTSVAANVRSEKHGFMVFAYGTESSGVASAINNSVLIVVQSTLPQEPVAYDAASAWFANIAQPASAYTDTLVPITGSAFIEAGPQGNPISLASYSLYYQMSGDTTWTPIGTTHTNNAHSITLETWDTHGLTLGNYQLRLLMKDNYGDSVEAIKQVTLQPYVMAVPALTSKNFKLTLSPNPSRGKIMTSFTLNHPENVLISIYDMTGKIIKKQVANYFREGKHTILFSLDNQAAGTYFCVIKTGDKTSTKKFILDK